MQNNMIMDALTSTDMQDTFKRLNEGEIAMSGQDQLQEVIGNANMPNIRISKPKQKVRDGKKVYRNDKCPCNSGRKFKHCCIDSGKYNRLVNKD